jgi:hypothetical protein
VDFGGATSVLFLPNGMSGTASADNRFIAGDSGEVRVTVCGKNSKDYYRRVMNFSTTGNMTAQNQDLYGQATPPVGCFNN